MKALVTEGRMTRTVVWISLAVTFLMLDMRFPRLTADLVGSVLSSAYFIFGNGSRRSAVLWKTGYLALTVVMGLPWLITGLSYIVIYEIEERENREKDGKNGKER